MNRTEINDGSISLIVPENFKILSQQDVKEMGGKQSAQDWAIRDNEKHLMFNVAWRQIPFLASAMKVSMETTMKNTEKQISKQVAEFKKISDVQRTIGGKQASGFRYSYSARGTHMESEYLLVKNEKQHVAFISYGRTGEFEENYPGFAEILDSVEFK